MASVGFTCITLKSKSYLILIIFLFSKKRNIYIIPSQKVQKEYKSTKSIQKVYYSQKVIQFWLFIFKKKFKLSF